VSDDVWTLRSYEVHAQGGGTPEVSVTLERAGEPVSRKNSGGDGPLDALFRTIEEITDTSVVVRDFRVHSVTRGKDAQGESTIEVEHEGRIYRGRGVSTDTVEAATLAFLNAVNRVAAGAGQPIETRPQDTV
jgi:2-isopropylmalate synthase